MPPTAEVTAKVSPARSYPEPFRVTGPLLSLVFRTEDVWQRCNQFIKTAEFSIRDSPSHSYNAGRAGDDITGVFVRKVIDLAFEQNLMWANAVDFKKCSVGVVDFVDPELVPILCDFVSVEFVVVT